MGKSLEQTAWSFPTETVSDQESASLTDEDTIPLSFTFEEFADCGLPSRDVAAPCSNNQAEESTSNAVYARMVAG